MWPNTQETLDLLMFTREILNGKLHFLCSERVLKNFSKFTRKKKHAMQLLLRIIVDLGLFHVISPVECICVLLNTVSAYLAFPYSTKYNKWIASILNPFVPNAPFLFLLKISENRKVFWCFQRVEKRWIWNEWVYMILKSKSIISLET